MRYVYILWLCLVAALTVDFLQAFLIGGNGTWIVTEHLALP